MSANVETLKWGLAGAVLLLVVGSPSRGDETSGFGIDSVGGRARSQKNVSSNGTRAVDTVAAMTNAGSAGPLTLNDCFKAALRRSDVLANQQELVAQAEENCRKARGVMLPDISGSYAYIHQSASGFDSSGNARASANQQTFKVTAGQPLFRGFRYFAALDQSKASLTAEKQAREWAGMQLYKDVAQAFYNCLAVQRDVRVLDKELDLYERRLKELQARVDIGRSKNTDVLTDKATMAVLKAQREQVLGQVDLARDVLTFLTGLDRDVPLDDTEAVPSQSGTLAAYQSRIPARPDVVAARKNVEASQSGISVAKGAYLPSVDLTGNYYFQRTDPQGSGAWDVGIAVTLPIFSGGIISADVKIAESQKRQSDAQLSQVQRLALEEIRSLYHNLDADLAQIRAFQDAFRLAEENYKANVKDYEFGLVSNLDVLQAQSAYQDTERSLERTRYQAKIDFHQLEASAANRLALMEGSETP